MAHTSVTNGRKATSPARIRLLDIISARRSIRSATTPANGPSVNHGTDRRPRATPTAAGLPVSWFTYTASAMNVTNDPASEIQSESQNALSSGVLKIPNSDAARRSRRTGIAGIMGRAARAGRSGHALALTRPGGGGQSARHAHTTSNPTWPPTHGGRPGGRGGAGRRLHREHRPGHRRQDPHRGSARVEVTGGTEVSYDVPLERGQFGGAATVLVYSQGGDLFSITGLGGEGSVKSGPTLPVVITTGSLLATSSEGECTIEVQDGDEVTGTVTCAGLDSSEGLIDVHATFSASA